MDISIPQFRSVLLDNKRGWKLLQDVIPGATFHTQVVNEIFEKEHVYRFWKEERT